MSMLSTIIAKAEVHCELKAGTIKLETVLSRVKRYNIDGIKPQQVSPLRKWSR
jgi:hypothetical protein